MQIQSQAIVKQVDLRSGETAPVLSISRTQ
jgi:hypothetical protein